MYAFCLLAGHATVLGYFLDTPVLWNLVIGGEPLCWPFFENCGQYRFGSQNGIYIICLLYLALILLGIYAEVSGRLPFKLVLGTLNLLLAVVVSLDYRLRANEFYMLFWLNLVFLFWRRLRWSIPLVIISFYFWAGRLKLNHEWLSGSVLYHDLWFIPPQLVPAACTYVVILEMVLTWGLLARRQWVRFLALAQLLLFHFESLSQIHWFYPALMVTMLAWFWVEFRYGEALTRPTLTRLVRGEAPVSAYAILLVFASLQLAPLFYRGDTVLNGQGRIFSLHMFEARQECEVFATLHWTTNPPEVIDLRMARLQPRIICDPIVYYSRIQNLCRSRATDGRLIDVDFSMRVKRTTETAFQTIIDEQSFCTVPHRYNVFASNAWIK